jgi:hypothetical protein
VTYAVMCSRLVWAFNGGFDTFPGWVGSNAYVWLSLVLAGRDPGVRVDVPARCGAPTVRWRRPGLADWATGQDCASVSTARVPAQEERRLVGA